MRTIIGIDNGVTGGITIIHNDGNISALIFHIKTPVKKELSYTKTKQWITRVDSTTLYRTLKLELIKAIDPICLLERPMLNPGRFKASVSAMRALEATLIILERLKIPVQYIDSKEWQRELLPKKLKGPELKMAAKSIAKRLFPQIKIVNADSLLLAEYGRRKYSKT